MIVFENKGLIDVRSVRTFGVSVKENEGAIGYFGTGLKYAIAIILRLDMDIVLYIDGQKYLFEKRAIDIRGKQFEIITMNGEEMPFTTELGKNWAAWQAFRELYCNTLDEGGTVYEAEDMIVKPGHTVFGVRGREMSHIFRNKHDIVLSLSSSLKLHTDSAEIYHQNSGHLYYKGIRVMNFEKPAMMTYNVLRSMGLTEDRTVASSNQYKDFLIHSIATMKDKPALRQILTATDGWQESDFEYQRLFWLAVDPSPEFLEVVGEEYKANNDRLNKTVREFQKRRMNLRASKHYEPETLTEVETKQLNRATDIISKVWPDFKDYKVMIVKTLGAQTMALADHEEQCMVVSKQTFHLGTKYLVSTLIEEYMHLKTSKKDCTRDLQNYLFDSLCTMIENHVIQEPI